MRRRFIDRCWEHMHCGEEASCPAFPDKGEECWLHAGSMCNSAAERRLDSLRRLAVEQGKDINSPEFFHLEPVKQVKKCKYLKQYGMCQCCPYYKYVEKKIRHRPKK